MFEINDLESVNNGLIERFNVLCLASAIGIYKHITSKRISEKVYELEVSGLISMDKDGNFIDGDCKMQTNLILENLKKAIISSAKHYNIILSEEDSLNYVTSTYVFLNNMSDFPLVNQAYEESKMPYTCRAAFAVKELPLTAKGALVEIRANVLISV